MSVSKIDSVVSSAMGAQVSIKLAVKSLLSELSDPVATGWLQATDDPEGTRAGIVATINEQQLLTFIRDLANQGRISPKAPTGSNSYEMDGDWVLTSLHRNLLHNALIQRIAEGVQKVEALRRAVVAQDGRLAEEKRTAGRYTLDEAAAAPGEGSKWLLEALLNSASAMTLPVYYPGEKLRVRNKQGRVSRNVEAYWHDLNHGSSPMSRRSSFDFLTRKFNPPPQKSSAGTFSTSR